MIKQEWIDVAPSGEGGQLKGTLPRDDKIGACCGIFEAAIDTIPRSEWSGIITSKPPSLRDDVVKIKNQRSEGSCTSNAATQGWETIHTESLGKDVWVELSPISVYKRVARSAQSGSTVGDNVREMRDVGALPTHAEKSKLQRMGLNPDHTMPETGFGTPMPRGWQETAKYFRISEYFDIESIEGFFTALLRGFCVHYGRAGHSILGVEAKQQGNTFYVCYANSWAPSWGENGFGYDSESFIRSSINSYGAYAYRSTVKYDLFQKLADNPLPSPEQ